MLQVTSVLKTFDVMYTVNFPSRIQNVRNNKNGTTSIDPLPENFLATQAGDRDTACVYLGHIRVDR